MQGAEEAERPSDLTEMFLARARLDAARLDDLVEMLATGLPSYTLASIASLAHRLHGGAALHGFPAVETAAVRLERLAEELRAGELEPLPGQCRAVTGAARQLCAMIEQIAD